MLPSYNIEIDTNNAGRIVCSCGHRIEGADGQPLPQDDLHSLLDAHIAERHREWPAIIAEETAKVVRSRAKRAEADLLAWVRGIADHEQRAEAAFRLADLFNEVGAQAREAAKGPWTLTKTVSGDAESGPMAMSVTFRCTEHPRPYVFVGRGDQALLEARDHITGEHPQWEETAFLSGLVAELEARSDEKGGADG